MTGNYPIIRVEQVQSVPARDDMRVTRSQVRDPLRLNVFDYRPYF
jgi:hypothetical protein